ncbi:DNA mismatch repair protein MutS [Brevundimonas intermedia]|uniref:DNA mismatch repair protein MutS n=1 Tax=Brevundimonas intermedia TaxID=74315 RepID=A0ABQ5T9Y0_9CAUL|nr:Smr/MutS family protein [Brevundimonas intermedia]GLK49401.1 DNA mismatch repair protein MutS [Brevundimonas intermedia]
MKRKGSGRDENGLTPEDRRIWSRITGTVAAPRSRKPARVTPGAEAPAHLVVTPTERPRPLAKPSPARTAAVAKPTEPRPVGNRTKPAPEDLEPRRKQRLSRERDPIEARIDLHGFGRFEAEDQLRAFLTSCQARGMRAVLVITGQGRLGGGVIRASFGEWMQAPGLRSVVSGFTVAHQRHGGNGAFYVTLKRRA